MTISKDIKFDCAHMLSNYEGKCANLHGHTYHGTVTLEGDIDPETGMLIDYNRIKDIVDEFDHAIVFSDFKERGDAETNLWLWANDNQMKYVTVPDGKSTAENMATMIAQKFIEIPNVLIAHVRLSETDGSWAIVEVEK